MTPITSLGRNLFAVTILWSSNLFALTPSPAVLTYRGLCDASAAVALTDDLFAVADDEENVIQVYSLSSPGDPVTAYPLASIETLRMGVPEKGKKKHSMKNPFAKKGQQPPAQISEENVTSDILKLARKSPEADLEGGARIGNTILWLGSHSRDSKGKEAPSRKRIFFTQIQARLPHAELQAGSVPYEGFLDDLANSPSLSQFHLNEAATRSPKQDGGLNIEGLASLPSGRALIGFRGPLFKDKALMITVDNPLLLSATTKAHITSHLLLDLGARGIKALALVDDGLLIAAGSPSNSELGAIYFWKNYPNPTEHPVLIMSTPVPDFNVEAFLPLPERKSVLMLSDDGTKKVDGEECKRLDEHSKRSFRAVEVPITALVRG